ncbi:zf-MIZ-domain-containing protein [Anaeromyces robustus]|uniref:Zf-MIZ-domain-containing protein n=1 Tax=Anaeromyces robustus TaxID=1754192 RepID=A0A1Y1WS29_9FUNG|nr:zf-MIZ-domain-containing protein [Anaeromyces robustus]|eukprot:ORX76195.1 zf-MIZ-domain-containing protein [Anaeromyces robustus]
MQSQVNSLLQLPFHHLKVADLREILRILGLKRSGNKDILIDNLKFYLRKLSQTSDIHSLTDIRNLLYQYLPQRVNKDDALLKPAFFYKSNQIDDNIYKNVKFVKTPFIKPLHVLYCGPIPFNLIIKFSLTDEQTNIFQKEGKKYKILLYSATQNTAKETIKNGTDCPIQYPCNPVIKVNEICIDGIQDIIRKHNKSWSTKPADLTNYCKKKNNPTNEVRLLSTFISSKWKDFMVKIIICEYLTLQETVNKIKTNFVTKEEILRQRLQQQKLKKNIDDEVETTSSNVSLRCPISRARIKIPSRFKKCTHVQCFDLSSILQLNENYSDWRCPICNSRYDWKSLIVDGYIQDILNNVSADIDSIRVEVNGTWHIDESIITYDKNLHYESEEDEEENKFFEKLEAELKAAEKPVIDLTSESDDDAKGSEKQNKNQTNNQQNVSLTEINRASVTTSIPSISVPANVNLETVKNLSSNRKRTLADLITPHNRKKNEYK